MVSRSLLEVLPALVVDGDDRARPEEAAQLDRLSGGHRVAQRSSHREAHARRGAARRCRRRSGRPPDERRRRGPCRPRSRARHAPGRSSAARSRSPWPASGRLSGGPWRQGVAVTSIDGFPGALEPHCLPRLEPAGAARRVAGRRARWSRPARGGGRSARPAASRLSPWWSWLSSTASIGGSSEAAMAGPVSLRDAVPQPNEYRAARGVERRIGQQAPAGDLDQDRRPADMREADVPHRLLPQEAVPLGRAAALAWLNAQSSA